MKIVLFVNSGKKISVILFIFILSVLTKAIAEDVYNNTVSYKSSPAAVNIGLDGTTGSGGDAEGDIWNDLDNLRGSDYSDVLTGNNRRNNIFGEEGDDTFYGLGERDELYGRAGNDVFYGGEGNDYINGHEGDDVLNGEEGSDHLVGGPGADQIDGGEGDNDYVNYYGSLEGVNVKLDGSVNSGGDAQGDTVDNVERMRGSEHADVLTGNDERNAIFGEEGDDTFYGLGERDELYGRAGNDVFYGGEGNDYINGHEGDDVLNGEEGSDHLVGGPGADQIDGGEGDNDYVNYYGSLEGVNVKLDGSVNSGGDAQGDTVDNVERMRGSEHADVLTGNDERNAIFGEEGDDTFYGLGERDELYGRAGNDVFYGGEGNDYINGHEGDDVLNGEEGSDHLVGGPGADQIDGGEGDNDYVNYYGSLEGVNVKLDGSVNSGGDAQGDTVDNVERMRGSEHADVLTGNDERNAIFGEEGDDTFYGLGERDELYGRAGNDVFYGGEGNDYINGHEGDDVLNGGKGDDYLVGGVGDDVYHFSPVDGKDSITESVNSDGGNDTLIFENVSQQQLWFSNIYGHLQISIINTDTVIRIRDWFTLGSALENIQIGNDIRLEPGQVQNLVDAMAFIPPRWGQILNVEQSDVDSVSEVIESAWSNIEIPDNVDSDGDGFSDKLETRLSTDPNDANDKPQDNDENGIPDIIESITGTWQGSCYYLGGGEYQQQTLVITQSLIKHEFRNASSTDCQSVWSTTSNQYEYSFEHSQAESSLFDLLLGLFAGQEVSPLSLNLIVEQVTIIAEIDAIRVLNATCSKNDLTAEVENIVSGMECNESVVFPEQGAVHYQLLQKDENSLKLGDKLDVTDPQQRATELGDYDFVRTAQ